MIIIDIHEPIDLIEKIKNNGTLVKMKRLSVADYVVGDIGIERKTTHDLIRSIIDKRIFSQLKRLKEAYKKSIIIIEGNLEETLYLSKRPYTILGELISITLDYDMGIIYSRNKEDTAKILQLIWKRMFQRKPSRTVVRYKPKIISSKERLIYIMEGFPGIGEKLAINILNHYGTLRDFANSTKYQLMEIEGLGEKKAQGIVNLLNLDYRKLT